MSKGVGQKFDLYHSTYARIKKDVRKTFDKHILTVHDLTPLKFDAQYFHPNQKAITNRILNSIQKEDHIICISENTRQDLLDHTNLNPENVFTVHNGYNEQLFKPVSITSSQKILSKFGLENTPYFMTLSALGKHKNIKTYLQAGYELHQSQTKEFKIVIVGKENQHVNQLLLDFPQEYINKRIIITGYVADEYLPALYSSATAFIFPSLYEGFGLPLLEAMACGAPILYSKNSSLPEIAGPAGYACETLNGSEYCHYMMTILENRETFENQRTISLQRAKEFSLRNWISNTVSVYKTVLKK